MRKMWNLQAFAQEEAPAEAIPAEAETAPAEEAEQVDAALVQRHWAGVAQIYDAWMEQAEQLKQVFPDFDLRGEMRDARFARLLRSGVDLQTAYQALHGQELLNGAMQYAARMVQQKMADALRSGRSRPAENGLLGGGAVMAGGTVAGMSRQDYDRVCRMVERGERVSFG